MPEPSPLPNPSQPSAPEPDDPAPIKGFLETSFLDWRGAIAAVLFLPGCNFRCPYCHNFALIGYPQSLPTLPLKEVLQRLSPFQGWLDGVVVSGGEPTLQPGLADLLGSIKQAGFAVKLDTNGHRPWVLRELLDQGLVDMVAMDLKAPLRSEPYHRAAGRGVDLGRIAESLDLLMNASLEHEFRTTIAPAWHGRDELEEMAKTLEGCQRWSLQAMNPSQAWNKKAIAGLGSYSPQEVSKLQAEVADPVCRQPLGGA